MVPDDQLQPVADIHGTGASSGSEELNDDGTAMHRQVTSTSTVLKHCLPILKFDTVTTPMIQ